MKPLLVKIKGWLATLSFRTGVIVGIVCLACYAISFAQMLLPISLGAKSALWITFFGLAKTAQYSALLILGKAGVQRVRKLLRRRAA